jgi:hypothetical protein
MSAGAQDRLCAEISALLVFYVCDEVSDQERAVIDEHLTHCAACQAQLSEEREFSDAIAAVPRSEQQLDPAGILLSQCRSELAEKLDDFERPAKRERARAYGWLRGWMSLHPAMSAAMLVLFGLIAGTQYSQWSAGRDNTLPPGQAMNVRPGPRITDDQLSKMAVAGINLTPSPYPGSQNVRVRMSAEQPVELNGNLDDSDVRNVLTFVVKSGERFDSGVRLDCLDVLKTRVEDVEVREAILSAARKDQNPAVRLKALEALRDTGLDGEVRQTLLDAIKHDSNPGVRVEAVNLLVRSLEQAPGGTAVALPRQSPDGAGGQMIQASTNTAAIDGSIEDVVRALDELQRSDSSRYVRLRSAAALREISARNDQ